jgi:hypothetical protein
VETIFDDCPGKWLFFHQINGIPNEEVWEITFSYEVNCIITCDMALASVEYVTTATKDYGYAECEY